MQLLLYLFVTSLHWSEAKAISRVKISKKEGYLELIATFDLNYELCNLPNLPIIGSTFYGGNYSEKFQSVSFLRTK